MTVEFETLQINLLCDYASPAEGGAGAVGIPKVALESLADAIVPSITRLLALCGVTEEIGEDGNPVYTSCDQIYSLDPLIGGWNIFTKKTFDRGRLEFFDEPMKIPQTLLTDNKAGISHTTLRDGSTLISSTGANLGDPTVAYYFNPANQIEPFHPIPSDYARKWISREYGAMVTLLDGRVIRFKGESIREDVIRQYGAVETAIYDPTNNEWSELVLTGDVNPSACCIVMASGDVLVSGGMSEGHDGRRCKILQVRTMKFVEAGDMHRKHAVHAGCLLPTGEVFICGGMDRNGARSSVCEKYDPVLNEWTRLHDLKQERWDHSCTLLKDGTIFIASDARFNAPCEIYDPITETSRLVPGLPNDMIDYVIVPIYT
jgi:hypothetical protein